jgi:hypothetical protein
MPYSEIFLGRFFRGDLRYSLPLSRLEKARILHEVYLQFPVTSGQRLVLALGTVT